MTEDYIAGELQRQQRGVDWQEDHSEQLARLSKTAATGRQLRVIGGLLGIALLLLMGGVGFLAIRGQSASAPRKDSPASVQPVKWRWLQRAAHFRSGPFSSGSVRCDEPAAPCEAFRRVDSRLGDPDTLEQLILNRAGPMTVWLVGSHDSQEMTPRLRRTLHDNETLAMSRAGAVQDSLLTRLQRLHPPARVGSVPPVDYFISMRPAQHADWVADEDRTVEVTVIVSQAEIEP